MAEEKAAGDVPDVDEEDDEPTFKAPAPKALSDIVGQDQDDESLVKYKKLLLAGAEGGGPIIIDEAKDNAIVQKLVIIVDGHPDLNLEIDLTQPLEEIKKKKIVLKEGCKYWVQIQFKIQREIVSGLRYEQKVFRAGVRVSKDSHMVGSYGPKYDMQMYKTAEETAPSGLLARGDYKVESRFVDDDKKEYLAWEWHLCIKKDFE